MAKSARRGLWIGLLLLHAPAAYSLFTSLENTGSTEYLATAAPRILGMISSCILFVLKALDVPWLRIQPTWRTLFTVGLVLGLIHMGALDKAHSGTLDVSPFVLGFVIVCGVTTSISVDLRGKLRQLAAILGAATTDLQVRINALRLAFWNRPVRPTRVYSFGALRAPPLA